MKLSAYVAVLVPFLIAACASPLDGHARCTLQTVGRGDGAAIISATLLIPSQLMHGAEINNGGVVVLGANCDYALNATLSDETAQYLIDKASDFPLIHEPSNSRVANAELSVMKDSNGQAFDVVKVLHLSPVTDAPTFSDAKYFYLRKSGS